jgi:conjugative relaxase-like TrwC/TraI family protein
MLSIAKLRVGQEAYQLSGVAESLDDYYTGSGEAHGQWVGGGAARLGLEGQVTPEDLRAVLAGLRPDTGGLDPNGNTHRPHPRRVPGFDLTFKAPKSASVLYAVSDDPRVQGAVIEAGEAAMRSAIGWLEREAIQVQRGSHRKEYLESLTPERRAQAGPKRLGTTGLVCASFRHRTSRASDPLLHWHVLTANLVEGDDGKWSAFAHPEIYHHARAAGEIFQTTFRAELTEALGVEWRPGNAVPEIAGIPQALLDQFSKRSIDIEAWLEATGTPNTPEGRQAAVLATRRNKPEVEGGRFDAAWKIEAEAAGWGPDMADGLIASCADRSPVDFDGAWRLETDAIDEDGAIDRYERTVEPEEWIADLLRRDLTSDTSTFTQADITQAVAARQGNGADIETIERLVAKVIASPNTISVATNEHSSDRPRWTSRELADVEARFVTTLALQTTTVVPEQSIAAAIADRPTIGDDQQVAVDAITRSDSAVSVLVGPAGTGKTFTIDAIRDAYERSGIRVLGAAPSARAAVELHAAGQVPTTTLHRLLDNWNRGYDHPHRDSMLVIDEAGMADIRTLTDAVTRQIDAGGRVLLVGDHHQLPEIGAGGGFAHAAAHGSTVAELTVNRRQHHQWEHTALEQLRNGNVATAVTQYNQQDRVLVAADPNELITQAIALWANARADGLNPIMLAGTNDIVDRLNQAAIEHLIATGHLDDIDPLDYGTTSFRQGERVLARRNAIVHTTTGDTTDLANGQAGIVTSAADDAVTIALDGGPHIRLDDTYLTRGGHVTHAYALTTHRAQGGTWDLAIAVGADSLYREAAYVQLSRGTHSNHLLLTDPEAATLLAEATTEAERHDTGLTPADERADDIDTHLTERLTRSRGKQLAHTLDPDLGLVNDLATTIPFNDLVARRNHALTAERLTTTWLGHDGADLTQERDRLEHTARRLAIGIRISPADRDNVGTVTAIDDHAATATVQFVSVDNRTADRTFDWRNLRTIDNTLEQQLTPTAEHTLTRLLDELDDRIADWNNTLATHGVNPSDASRFGAAVERATEQATNMLRADQPEWTHQMLGHRPVDVVGAHTWDGALRDIARWRLTADIPARQPGLGPAPITPEAYDEWRSLTTKTADTRVWLATTDRTLPDEALTRTVDQLLERSDELDEILDAAPADCRHIIDELHSGQLTLDDTAELLTFALQQQGDRRDWIIEHWPHIVEYQEIDRALLVWGSAPTFHELLPVVPADIGPEIDF